MRHALVIQHVAFEDLGTLAPALAAAGYSIEYLQAGVSDLDQVDPKAADLLIVLGGPIGVYEQAIYPFLSSEIQLLTRRLAAERPTLGICLGAQLMASALGARVYAGTSGKEIGWSPITRGSKDVPSHPLSALFAPGVQVLHWHGDTFDLPQHAVHLAQSSRYANQAFALGDFGLALQFHPEVELAPLERWYIGHTAELSQAGISIPDLRAAGREHAPRLARAAGEFWPQWLERLR